MQTGYKVLDVMTNKPIIASKEMSLVEAAKLMDEENVNSLLIEENEKAKGIITDEDLVRKVIAKGLDPKKARLKDVMSQDLVTIKSNRDIYDALILMRQNNIRQLPVVDNDKLVGFLTSKDILKLQPELFDIFAEKYEIREQNRKLQDEDPLFYGLKKKKR
ncbi:TPA: CBS domain-containing protein [Candidatus Woesearchaeota archaeon]|nr:CBS domain-containing protein [Candidatus Woesearchaeota archaeon]HIH54434.1 CBS domain-containing protein [Candidatus Woesearchaeota archaeon]HIJ02282.1 CBS domain-containing protein [Candidatus Woesearchaeota archaeon]HIJ14226.1 CBS domain-containing protein [Candidatus Woesearchaeota archaeon]